MNININGITFNVKIDEISYRTHKASSTLEEYKGQLVGNLIRKKYLLNDELAIHRKRDSEPEEFAAYNEYAENCVSAINEAFANMELIINR
jgi:hypothetical protein